MDGPDEGRKGAVFFINYIPFLEWVFFLIFTIPALYRYILSSLEV